MKRICRTRWQLAMCVALALILVSPLLFCRQTDPATTLRLAVALEQAGEFERALPLYRDLYFSDPGNVVYFDGLQRVLLQLKRYGDAVALTRQRLAAAPNDRSLRCQLGSNYYLAGEEHEAFAQWDSVLSQTPASPTVYRMVAGAMLENRLLDKAADVYRRARTALSDPDLFSLELAQLLSVTMDYRGATAEYLRWLRRNPGQLSFVESRMGAFTGKPDGRKGALAAVEAAQSEQGNAQLLELLAWLQLEGKEFGEAFETYKQLDRQTHAQGNSVYAFAERAYQERAFGIAAQAYQEAIHALLAHAKIPYAEYGYACALKELQSASDSATGGEHRTLPVTESQPDYGGAVAAFRNIIASYPHTEFSAKSYYQIGLIEFQKYFDLDGALRAFHSVDEELPGADLLRYDVALRMAAIYTAKADTARASIELKTILLAPNATPDQGDEASYRLAEIDYFEGRFQKAVQRLEAIALNLKADYANDALQLLAFLRENAPGDSTALSRYAAADLLARQRKNTEAIAMFQQVIHDYPRAPLVDDALMTIAGLQSDAGLYPDAIATYGRLLTEFKESSVGLDRAQFRLAEIYQFGLRDRAKAISAYELLLASYPSSVLADRARKRIRELRGDAL